MNNYGNVLKNGKWVAVDAKEAVRYYKMSADEGNAFGISKLAYMIYMGEGIKQDTKEVVCLVKISADKGCTDAIESYANCLENGDGVPKNIQEANRYRRMLNK